MQEEITMVPGISVARQNMEAYFKTHDVKYIAEDAVFIHMSDGKRVEGKAAIGDMLHFMYHIAFDARAEFTNSIITENKALVEGRFKGKHIGEINGIAATNKLVDVPMAVSYDLENGLIKEARVYMMVNVLVNQLTGA
jgi:hypothetical protein